MKNNNINKNILIISAHADDHLMCAGTIFKLRDMGYSPYEIVYTDSSLGQDFRVASEISQKQNGKTRKQELQKASKFLGVKKTYNFGQPDLGLLYSKKLMFKTIEVIREIRPQIAILMNEYDTHPDHLEAYKIGINAIKIAATEVKKISLGEPFRVPTILCSEGMLPVKTQISVDITDFINKKIKLLKIYESQCEDKLINYMQGLSYVRGWSLRNGGRNAENFTLPEDFPNLMFENL